eukprot:CAMPEP_0206531416 /NCGR_PEP_ID=MMETSP0325_2-20121206/3748_1 /ASSEMBLY_ACC=CAM_ASM_000347 /TAXON_ID=2866 /ORGANISM="Crypthecodinium cohnii, Strain Seligo" /LENGTH=609 /DNA_ID=CAMNT_0054027647 /DNA_START=117 /DNA_END=1946 /DNA_ORIENTATION=+
MRWRRLSAVQGVVTGNHHLLDALWLSDTGCELGFSIGIHAVQIGFFVGRKLLLIGGAVRSFASTNGQPSPAVIAVLGFLGALLGGLLLFGLWVLATAGEVARRLLDGVPICCWPLTGALLVIGFGLMLTLPPEKPYYKALKFLDEVLWFADVVTWASLSASRKLTHICLVAATQAVGVLGRLDFSTTLQLCGGKAASALMSPRMISELGNTAEMFSTYVVQVSKEARLPELLVGVKALARLQSVAGRRPKGRCYKSLEELDCCADIQRYVWFALGMHGHAGLKFLGAIHYGSVGSDLEALAYCASIPPSAVLISEWKGGLHSPGYALSVDESSKSLVLSIRGTLWPQDWITDFDCRPRQCELLGKSGYAHSGMLTAAETLSSQLTSIVAGLLRKYSDFRLVLTGHSLGAGVAALLSALWLTNSTLSGDDLGRRLRCIAFGTPSVTSPELSNALRDHVTSVVCGHDFVPRFSLRSSNRLRDAVLRLWRQPGTAAAVLAQHPADTPNDSEKSQVLAREQLSSLMEGDALGIGGSSRGRGTTVNEACLCPPGQVFWKAPNDDTSVVAIEDPRKFFEDIPLGPVKDIFEPHLPQNYSSILGGGKGPLSMALSS